MELTYISFLRTYVVLISQQLTLLTLPQALLCYNFTLQLPFCTMLYYLHPQYILDQINLQILPERFFSMISFLLLVGTPNQIPNMNSIFTFASCNSTIMHASPIFVKNINVLPLIQNSFFVIYQSSIYNNSIPIPKSIYYALIPK
jgi:hypothetical protein